MREEIKWGGAAALAIAAVVGISSQSSRPREGSVTGARTEQRTIQSKTAHNKVQTPCSDLVDLFQAFLPNEDVLVPNARYESGDKPCANLSANPKGREFHPKFIIATLPDPLHTHFSLLFDRFIEAIQQAAQDEGYEYDSSWLPWETEEPSFSNLRDEDEADDRTKEREKQPGVLLFRGNGEKPFQEPLVVFIVGEDPTHGIHRNEFENAAEWVATFQSDSPNRSPVGLLGPTFSGSFPSLTELLSNERVRRGLIEQPETTQKPLAIYSGSATGKDDAEEFAHGKTIVFHSFLQDDDTSLNRFCEYLAAQKPGEDKNKAKAFDLARVAILSEDETAYGYRRTSKSSSCGDATWLYYPRDISTLRAAYQTQSIFSSGSSQPTQDPSQRKSLSTDLADPAGKEHDTVRTYAGNQTPLSQEAQLLGLVGTLRSHRAQYVVLRSSNTLDPLFLANFLRLEYPQARIVILNSDLLFQRGQDAMQLSGVMTLSTYPLFPLERDWTIPPPFYDHDHRVFPESSTEATYIASRLLLHSSMFFNRGDHPGCAVVPGSDSDSNERFLPSIVCPEERETLPSQDNNTSYVPIPDYAPPFWTKAAHCERGGKGDACKPATWLSVITKSGSWPLAALNDETLSRDDQSGSIDKAVAGFLEPEGPSASQRELPPIPLSMKVFLVFMLTISVFHAACCWFASFTAKPAFRAHFAMEGWRHRMLIVAGSFIIAVLAIFAGWGNGVFSWRESISVNPWLIRGLVFLVCTLAGLSIVANSVATRRLHQDKENRDVFRSNSRFKKQLIFLCILFGLLVGVAFVTWVMPIEYALTLANRVPAYWRAMNLTSGVSPLVPFLSLTLGLYIWFWYSLHGLALFGPDRPLLPHRRDLIVQTQILKNLDQGESIPLFSRECAEAPVEGVPSPLAKDRGLDILPMFSREYAATPVEDVATPLACGTLAFTFFLFITFFFVVNQVLREIPLRSLGARTYAIIFCLWLGGCFSLVLGAAWQLWRTWSRLRQLLVFLDRMPLRRTLGALRGFSWGTVWKMSGNVLDVRYKLLSRQLESLNHLHTSLQEFLSASIYTAASEIKGAVDCLTAVDDSRRAGIVFAKWYSASYRDPKAAGLRRFEEFQEQIAITTGRVLTDLLIPAWRKEKHSLILVNSAESDEYKDDRKQPPPESAPEHICNAEELVCLTYLGFTQNILGRIRTIALGALFVFVATTVAVANYPFDPRPAISGVLVALFLLFGAVIVFVYADMHRDVTLSHITNTNPGELGSEFWLKIVGFGAAPLLGLIAAIFPEHSGSLFSWLQPGLTSLK